MVSNSVKEKDNSCPCCSGQSFANCCQPYLLGEEIPSNAEQLMRSRYTAYTQINVDYIEQTMRGQALHNFNKEEAQAWAQNVTWQKLIVLRSWHSSANHAYVEFMAYFQDGNQLSVLHEISQFQRTSERWYYVQGVKPEVGRNQLCPCGSHKKAKRCCFV